MYGRVLKHCEPNDNTPNSGKLFTQFRFSCLLHRRQTNDRNADSHLNRLRHQILLSDDLVENIKGGIRSMEMQSFHVRESVFC